MMPLRRTNRAVRMAPVPSTAWAPLRWRGVFSVTAGIA